MNNKNCDILKTSCTPLALMGLAILGLSILSTTAYGQCDRYGYQLSGTNPCNEDDFVLIFEDEFNGNSLDQSKWLPMLNWGRLIFNHDELQGYFEENIEVNNGTLKLIAREEWTYAKAIPWEEDPDLILEDGEQNERWFQYTSGAITSKYKFFTGKYEIRCRLPEGKLRWPAFWAFGGQVHNELDIFDNFRGINTLVYGMLQDHNNDGSLNSCGNTKNGYDFSLWHTITCVFDLYTITFLVDGNVVDIIPRVITSSGNVIQCGEPDIAYNTYFLAPFPLENMHIIANLAISPRHDQHNNDPELPFPSTFEIDYIKFYKRKNCCNNKYINDVQEELNLDPIVLNFICGEIIDITGTENIIHENQNLKLSASHSVTLNNNFDAHKGSFLDIKVGDNNCSINKLSHSNHSESTANRFTDPMPEQVPRNNLDIFPNPARTHISIIDPSNVLSYEIFDVQGRRVLGSDNNQNMMLNSSISFDDISIMSLTPGIYTIKLEVIRGDKKMYEYVRFLKE